MVELSNEIEVGSAKVPMSLQGASLGVEQQLEKELFDIECTFVYFGDVHVVNYLTAVLCVGFKKELEGFGTRDLGRVVAVMKAKALVARRVLLRGAKAESDKMLEGSAERLRLVVENEKLKKELAVLQALNDSRKKQNEKLEERARRHDVVIAEM